MHNRFARIAALLLCLCLPLTPALAEQTLTVSGSTALAGHFATELWSNSTSDADVRALLHGHSTVAWTRDLGLAVDETVVQSLATTQHADGSRTYVLHIRPGLRYSDGTPITASDYVFSLLLTGTPALREIGATPQDLSHLVGGEAFQRGETDCLAGVRLLSAYAFSLHVRAEAFPYFYGFAHLNITPYPIHVIAPGCAVRDDGQGAYIGRAGEVPARTPALAYTPGDFDAAMLRQTMLDPDAGYLFAPRVTSGPYQLETVDLAAQTAVFAINPFYGGNYEGQRPAIDRLIYTCADGAHALQGLADGRIGLVNKVSQGALIGAGEALIAQGTAVRSASYARTGLALLSFACEASPTDSLAVRQAVALCVDREAIAMQDATGIAVPVHGYYGLGQWMLTAREGMFEAVDALKVPFDVVAAGALLEADGWRYAGDGAPYMPGQGIRHRLVGETLEPLVLRWAISAESAAGQAVAAVVTPALAQAGIGVEITHMPFAQLLRHYYRQEARAYDLFFIATNFPHLFDPAEAFHDGDAYQGRQNTTGVRDAALRQAAVALRETDPSDTDAYLDKWLLFQERFVQALPLVPLYSNIYYDFYAEALQGYDITAYPSWALAILYATL